ncbi:MAG: hypothetical protein LBQ60_07785 [Bacteroidales bacterium]|nr:hypothetical protein [Bacteroidales bacterium]
MKTKVLIFWIFFLFPGLIQAQVDWRSITTVNDVCTAFPEQVKSLFEAIDLDHSGLKDVK